MGIGRLLPNIPLLISDDPYPCVPPHYQISKLFWEINRLSYLLDSTCSLYFIEIRASCQVTNVFRDTDLHQVAVIWLDFASLIPVMQVAQSAFTVGRTLSQALYLLKHT